MNQMAKRGTVDLMEDVDQLLTVVDTPSKSRAAICPQVANMRVAVHSGNLAISVAMSLIEA
jgi:hypothetical protein